MAEAGILLTEHQLAALEKKKDDDIACGEIETVHPGYLGSQDTYSKIAFCKLYTTKTPITAADLLNDHVLPFFELYQMSILRLLIDRGTEFCRKTETHDYEFYLAVNDIEHTKTKANHPQTNGICEWFHKTILEEFYQVTF